MMTADRFLIKCTHSGVSSQANVCNDLAEKKKVSYKKKIHHLYTKR